VIEDNDKRTKGADSHKDYKEAVKTVLRKVVENANECNQSVRAAATQAQATLLKDYNISLLVFHGAAP
jgi:gas vesicle protein